MKNKRDNQIVSCCGLKRQWKPTVDKTLIESSRSMRKMPHVTSDKVLLIASQKGDENNFRKRLFYLKYMWRGHVDILLYTSSLLLWLIIKTKQINFKTLIQWSQNSPRRRTGATSLAASANRSGLCATSALKITRSAWSVIPSRYVCHSSMPSNSASRRRKLRWS